MASNKSDYFSQLNYRDNPPGAPILGELEVEVLESLWQKGPATAQQVLAGLETNKISLSTVQSTLERLVRKQLLSRTKQGRAFVYQTIIDREHLIGLMIQNVAFKLANGRITPMLSGFCSFVEENGSKRKARDLAAVLRQYMNKVQKS